MVSNRRTFSFVKHLMAAMWAAKCPWAELWAAPMRAVKRWAAPTTWHACQTSRGRQLSWAVPWNAADAADFFSRENNLQSYFGKKSRFTSLQNYVCKQWELSNIWHAYQTFGELRRTNSNFSWWKSLKFIVFYLVFINFK